MAECNWDPNKHNGKPCPIHGSGKKSTDNPYSKGSLGDIEKQGWEGKHNYIINRMYNSDFDTIDEAMEAAERMNLDEKQMQYVEAVARRVFGEDWEDEKEAFDDDYDFDNWDDDEDEEMDPIEEMMNDGVDLTDKQEVLEYLGATLGLDREDQQAVLKELRSLQKNSKIKGTVVSSRRKPGTNDYQLSVDPDKAAQAINSDHKRANYYIDFLYDDFSENINNKDLDKDNTIRYWKGILSKIDDSKIQSDDKLRLMKAALDYGK